MRLSFHAAAYGDAGRRTIRSTGRATVADNLSPAAVYEFIPKLGRLATPCCSETCGRAPELSKRDRSLITVATLVALYRTDGRNGHMQRALANGVTEEELKGLITHLASTPAGPAVNAGRVAMEVFGDR